jgi:Tfp pilus assembly protein PilP
MKKAITFFLLFGLLYLGTQPLLSQEKKKAAKKDVKEAVKKELPIEPPRKPRPPYDPEGRRDPFRNLLAGREVVETEAAEGLPQMLIDNINLIGIVKIEGKLIAIVNSSKGFPFNIKVNDRLADGFVLSIEERRVIFRKTKERGITLIKPEDIVKEIKIEER